MTGVPEAATTEAVSGFLLERAHLLLPLAAQLGPSQPDFESAIHGNSMAPAIPLGARIRVHISRAPNQVGDVVFYRADDGYTVHRVLYRMNRRSGADYLLTAGDARFAPDPPVACDQVLGAVVAVESDGQWRPLGSQTPGPWHRRLVRAMTLPLMIITLWFSLAAADRLAVGLLSLESRARLTRRGLLRGVRALGSRLRRR